MRVPLILLVEDDSLVREVLAEELSLAGYKVLEAADGTQAAALLDGEPSIAALITDMKMPGPTDGLALAALARQNRPRLPVILMSGYSARLAEIPAGGETTWFMQKPFHAVDLVARLAHMLVNDAPAPQTPAGGLHPELIGYIDVLADQSDPVVRQRVQASLVAAENRLGARMERFDQASRLVEEIQGRIRRQQALIGRLDRQGEQAELAERFLANMETTLELLVSYRGQLSGAIDRDQP